MNRAGLLPRSLVLYNCSLGVFLPIITIRATIFKASNAATIATVCMCTLQRYQDVHVCRLILEHHEVVLGCSCADKVRSHESTSRCRNRTWHTPSYPIPPDASMPHRATSWRDMVFYVVSCIVSYRMASRRIASYRFAPCRFVSYRMVSHHITSNPTPSHYITSH